MIYCDELAPNYFKELAISTIKTNKKITFYDIESSLDIETTSTYVNGDEKIAFMYIWMFGIGLDNDVFYGRTWEQLETFLNNVNQQLELTESLRLVTYVHNLGYEFQFMRKNFNWLNVFAVDDRKPIKALCDLGIEFRDSYILSGFSLENTAKNLTKYKVKKMVGDLDYSLIRHSLTSLTDIELKYCENDVLVVLAYIKEQIEMYKNVSKIPLTNTGRVRDYVRKSCYYSSSNHRKSDKGKYIKYRKIMGDLTLELDVYKQLKRSFMGGFTHSSKDKTNLVLKGVDSIDLVSSYPTVMLSDKYPMSRPKKVSVSSVEELKKLFYNNCVVFDLRLKGVKNKIGYESYLSESKCFNTVKAVVNNGRIFEADELVTTITDVDFSIIEAVYSWDSIEVSNVLAFRCGYLPKPIIESILKLYGDKTMLKDVKGSEVEYLLSKGMLNSVYGMCVTDFIKDDHVYDETWTVEPVNAREKIQDYNKSKSRFLYYPWGIWVTAYARRNLWSAIINIGDDYIYSDTDSVKMLNYGKHKKYINDYNKHVMYKLEKMMRFYKLDVDMLKPKTINGKVKPLGVWEHEGHYTKFKTLGAKRYLIEENNNFFLTVAGLSKKNGIEHIKQVNNNDSDKIFKSFDDELYIPKEKTGKMTHTYLDVENQAMIKDYQNNYLHVKTLSSTHLDKCDFTLSISLLYKQFLQNLSKGYIFTGMQNK